MIQRDHSRTGRLNCTIAIVLLAIAALSLPAARASAQVPPTCPPALGTADLIDNVFSASFCELCDTGTVRIIVEKPVALNSPQALKLGALAEEYGLRIAVNTQRRYFPSCRRLKALLPADRQRSPGPRQLR